MRSIRSVAEHYATMMKDNGLSHEDIFNISFDLMATSACSLGVEFNHFKQLVDDMVDASKNKYTIETSRKAKGYVI